MGSSAVELINQGQLISSLSSTGLLALLVVVLVYIVAHLYKQQQNIIIVRQEKQVKGIEEIKEGIKESNTLAKEQIKNLKENNQNMMKFIELHCAGANEKLGKIDGDLSELNRRISLNPRLEAMLKEKNERS
ncbi:hypothetical protein [Campylobacter vulpis]|uniref:hypothetical protein n=1 Tax=Campylobacter vulpis TaxID=1655500 RepID=UPI000C14849F|nr:hypothetical protein [Campylobacter vulpis]MBS4275656.1 hypothetical protein [Campylobacter vulpis]MBS4306866.1 hypothetical protein [Campylobacter vulpis]MBS4329011.1 hypothetical protein [Campylobacter vulpis]MBS4407331.1 hypothetical protein [Campylobacter vulpis]MBS4422810.1 hypothetical protein [Campylobacter vulpis]